jgi:fatty acid desaturase
MKPDHSKHHTKTMTLGDLIACLYGTCSRRKAKAVLRFAINQHLIVFQGRQRFRVG